MARGSLNVWPVVTDWWSHDGRRRWLIYVVFPICVAIVVRVFGLQADNLGAFLTGSMFFTGILLNILFRVHGWSEEAVSEAETAQARPVGDMWSETRRARQIRAVTRLYETLTWATLVSLLLTVLLLVLNTEANEGQRTSDLVWTTAIVGAVGTHLALVVLAAVNRLFNVTRRTVRRYEQRSRESTSL